MRDSVCTPKTILLIFWVFSQMIITSEAYALNNPHGDSAAFVFLGAFLFSFCSIVLCGRRGPVVLVFLLVFATMAGALASNFNVNDVEEQGKGANKDNQQQQEQQQQQQQQQKQNEQPQQIEEEDLYLTSDYSEFVAETSQSKSECDNDTLDGYNQNDKAAMFDRIDLRTKKLTAKEVKIIGCLHKSCRIKEDPKYHRRIRQIVDSYFKGISYSRNNVEADLKIVVKCSEVIAKYFSTAMKFDEISLIYRTFKLMYEDYPTLIPLLESILVINYNKEQTTIKYNPTDYLLYVESIDKIGPAVKEWMTDDSYKRFSFRRICISLAIAFCIFMLFAIFMPNIYKRMFIFVLLFAILFGVIFFVF